MSEVITTPVVEATPAPETEVKVEAPVEKAPEKPKESASDAFLAQARKERAIVKKSQELAQQKQEFERQQKEFKASMDEFNRWKQLKENAKLDPDAYLNEAGLSYGSLTERNLKGGLDPNAILEKTNQTISQFKKEQEDARKQAEEAQKAAAQKEYEQNLQRYVESVNEFVETNKETYELITLHNQQHLIWEVQQAAGQRGTVLTTKQAADKVEQYLDEQVTKAMGAKKFKDKFTAVKKEETPEVKPGSPTLTNNLAQTTAGKQSGLITDQERTQRALAALNKALGE